MKIGIIVNCFPPIWLAGTEIATFNLAEHLAKRGHEIHVITSRDKGQTPFQYENGFYTHRLIFPRIRLIGTIFFWMNTSYKILKLKPDIIHAQNLIVAVPAYIIKKIIKIPYIVWGRGSDIYLPNFFFKIFLNKSILQNADAVLALTEDMREKIKAIVVREIFVVPNGINLESYTDLNKERRGEKANTIIFVGRLYPVKGVQYLIDAMGLVHKKKPEIKLNIVGDGPERQKLTEVVSKLGLNDCVHFLGKLPHAKIPEIMNNADIFVLPSLSEGFPSVILEAMACGLPIVATNVGGIPTIIEDSVNGYLVNPKRPEEIAEKIISLIDNEDLRMTMSVNNKEKANKYTWVGITNTYEKILLDCFRIYNLKKK